MTSAGLWLKRHGPWADLLVFQANAFQPCTSLRRSAMMYRMVRPPVRRVSFLMVCLKRLSEPSLTFRRFAFPLRVKLKPGKLRFQGRSTSRLRAFTGSFR